MLISLICVYNSEKILNKHLVKTVYEQRYTDYELITIDNTDAKYKNAGEALNYGAKMAHGDYLVFLHQDIEFLHPNSLKELESAIASNSSFGIAGLAGVDNKVLMYGNFLQGKERKPSGKAFDSCLNVESVDECFFVIPRHIYEDNPIWEFSWHLYAVEYALKMKNKKERVILLPCDIIYHLSPGDSLKDDYYVTMRKLCRMYREKTTYIYTTIKGKWPTSLFGCTIKTYGSSLKRVIKGCLK